MPTRYLSVPILLAAAILQTTIMADFQIREGRADLVFTLILSWTMLAGTNEGLIWAFVGGVCQDWLTGIPLGVSALALATVAFGAGWALGKVDRGGWLIAPIAAVIGTAVYHLLLIMLYTVVGRSASPGYSLLNVTLPGAALNAVLIIPVFRVLSRLQRITTPRRVRL